MVNLVKKETITLGPTVRCARHDITLPGHVETNVITIGNMSQPSYLTENQTRLVSGYLRLRMPEKKRCNTIWRDDIVRFSEMIYGSELWNKSSSVNQGEDEEVADRLSNKSSRFPKDGFPQLCEQGDNIGHIEVDNEVCSRKTYTIKHWLKGAPEIWAGLHDQRRNGNLATNTLHWNYCPLTLR